MGTVPGRYFVDTALSLTCSVNVSEAVDVDDFIVTESWAGPQGPISSINDEDRFTVMAAKGEENSSVYISTLDIDHLDILDSGNFSCNLTLTLTGDYPNIQPQAASGVDQFEVVVEGKTTLVTNA